MLPPISRNISTFTLFSLLGCMAISRKPALREVLLMVVSMSNSSSAPSRVKWRRRFKASFKLRVSNSRLSSRLAKSRLSQTFNPLRFPLASPPTLKPCGLKPLLPKGLVPPVPIHRLPPSWRSFCSFRSSSKRLRNSSGPPKASIKAFSSSVSCRLRFFSSQSSGTCISCSVLMASIP